MQGVCLKASPHYEYQLNLHIKRFNFSECPIYSDLTSSTFIHQYEKQIDHPRNFFQTGIHLGLHFSIKFTRDSINH